MKTTGLVNVLALIYIALPIVIMFIVMVLYLIGKSISKEILDKLLEFGKWYIVAVAIVFAAKLLDASFTDRETSIKEIALYDKYAANILEADNIEKRWKLSEYFAAVTPSEPLRERWEVYKTILKPEYETMIALKKQETAIVTSTDSLNPEQKVELLSIKAKQNSLNVKLINTNSYYEQYIIVFTTDTNLPQAQHENANLKKAGIKDPVIVNIGRLFFNISRDFNSKIEASAELDLFRGKVRGDVYITPSAKFCKNKINKDNYFSCE